MVGGYSAVISIPNLFGGEIFFCVKFLHRFAPQNDLEKEMRKRIL